MAISWYNAEMLGRNEQCTRRLPRPFRSRNDSNYRWLIRIILLRRFHQMVGGDVSPPYIGIFNYTSAVSDPAPDSA